MNRPPNKKCAENSGVPGGPKDHLLLDRDLT
jgi:hypothetical protein